MYNQVNTSYTDISHSQTPGEGASRKEHKVKGIVEDISKTKVITL